MATGSLAEALGQLLSGAVAGVAATFITNPLDTMKVEAQNGGMTAVQMLGSPALLWRGITVVLIESECDFWTQQNRKAGTQCLPVDRNWQSRTQKCHETTDFRN